MYVYMCVKTYDLILSFQFYLFYLTSSILCPFPGLCCGLFVKRKEVNSSKSAALFIFMLVFPQVQCGLLSQWNELSDIFSKLRPAESLTWNTCYSQTFVKHAGRQRSHSSGLTKQRSLLNCGKCTSWIAWIQEEHLKVHPGLSSSCRPTVCPPQLFKHRDVTGGRRHSKPHRERCWVSVGHSRFSPVTVRTLQQNRTESLSFYPQHVWKPGVSF